MTIDTKDNFVATQPGSAAPPPGFAARYAVQQSGRDEMLEPDGALRSQWRMLVSILDDLGPQEVVRRWGEARRLIRENGITHNVYGDPNGIDRPWNLDLVPLLIPQAEWREVADGLVQRSRLLDALLGDIYGPGRCIAERWLPPELVYANPGFLRPCHGITLARGQWLQLYSADLIRMADGQFRVMTDRTQAPSGAGYSLENRIVLSSILPTAFRQCNVHRLAPFFMALRRTLKSLAPANRENPRVVLLTPGPYNETYFEHAYLARYLGYTLVQGNDLTVREGLVFLKTLSGLQRIDVILRRVDDDFCDPLELYQHSYLGVPGLVEAVRQGNVAIANALGSGVLQAPAFLSFLPQLCRKLLGEELRLPSVQTWWCGEAEARKFVLANLNTLVIKPAFPPREADPVFGGELSSKQLQELADRINARPMDFVAQENIESRTAPVLLAGQTEARRFTVRAYTVADQGSYTVMSGGLTRVTSSPDSLIVSLQRGGGSKDTWILSEGPVTEASLLSAASQPVELSRAGGDLTSRVADDLFWLGRYMQRFEADVRLARCMFSRLMDQGRADVPSTTGVLAYALLGHNSIQMDETGLRSMVATVFATTRPATLRPAINHVRSLVRGLRDRVSLDAWRILQNIERDLSDFDPNIPSDQIGRVVDLLNRNTVDLLAFSGIVSESMTRGQAWRFLDMGLRVERAITMSQLVRATLVNAGPAESAVLDAVLEIADSSLTYRRRYLTQLEAPAVVDLLVADETNPRSVIFQLAALEEHLAQLPRDLAHPQRSPDRQTVLKLRTNLRLADLGAACRPARRGGRVVLGSLMTGVIDSLGRVSEWVSQFYFSHAAISRSLHGRGEERTK
ncbi:MAG: circularly permuted type 2 ATP-grasp protein [Planctomycetota bacterium]|nr:circularly permuted type 2 ATP-grasp protein [Planctomycetota bacterium]